MAKNINQIKLSLTAQDNELPQNYCEWFNFQPFQILNEIESMM